MATIRPRSVIPISPLAVALLAVALSAGCASPKAAEAPRPGTNVFYLQHVGQSRQLVAYDWAGKVVRTIHTAVSVGCCDVSQSPNGSRISVGGVVLNGMGRRLGPVRNLGDGVWADDDERQCFVGPASSSQTPMGGPAELYLVGTVGKVDRVARVGAYGPHTEFLVQTCDVASGQAVVFKNQLGMTTNVEVVDLTTGSVGRAGPSSAGGPCGSPWAVSPDGRLEATGSGAGGSICDVSSGKALGHIAGQPQSLSGSLVAEVVSGRNGFTAEVVDWRTDQILWTSPVTSGLYPRFATVAEPGGDGLAFVTNDGGAWLVFPGRPALRLDSDVTPGIV
jgi:hypothetical protein